MNGLAAVRLGVTGGPPASELDGRLDHTRGRWAPSALWRPSAKQRSRLDIAPLRRPRFTGHLVGERGDHAMAG
jgi:hypothetical protein